MKVLLVEPAPSHPARGNSVTARRWAEALGALGIEVVRAAPGELAGRLRWGPPPALIHAHHATHCGPAAARASRALGVPLVVSLGGTELHGPPPPEAVAAVATAAVVVGPFASYGVTLTRQLGSAPPYATVRRGVAAAELNSPRHGGGPLRLLVVGGLRPVKGQLRAVALARGLRDLGLDLTLTLAGPALDPGYAAAVDEALAGAGIGVWVGEVPHGAMDRVYGEVDCLLNTSDSEGASNAILEAWAGGLPVAARSAPGNRELLEPAPAEAAHLYGDDPESLAAWLRALAAEAPETRLARARAAQAHARVHHRVADEAHELLAAYRLALGGVSAPAP